jgi:hypothetical protein
MELKHFKDRFFIFLACINVVFSIIELVPFYRELRYQHEIIRKIDMLAFLGFTFLTLLLIGIDFAYPRGKKNTTIILFGSFFVYLGVKIYSFILIF